MTDYHKNKPYILDKMPHFILVIFQNMFFDSILLKYLQYITTGEVFNIFYATPQKNSA